MARWDEQKKSAQDLLDRYVKDREKRPRPSDAEGREAFRSIRERLDPDGVDEEDR